MICAKHAYSRQANLAAATVEAKPVATAKGDTTTTISEMVRVPLYSGCATSTNWPKAVVHLLYINVNIPDTCYLETPGTP